MLEIRNLTKIYDDGTRALNNVSFTVQEGEFLVVIGLSGSGKSTLLRCINRLIDPTEGEILWHGKDLAQVDGEDLRFARRKIGMIFQHFNLVKRSSVLNNVLSGRLGYTPSWKSLVGKFSTEDRQKAWDALERLNIRDQALKRADELSGGQQQRVGIARALMQEPEMILADEPVASLDPVLAHSILQYLEKLNKEDQIIDLKFDDFVKDQIGVVKKIYDRFDMHLSDEALAKFKYFLDLNPKDKKGVHVYTLEDFGLTEEEINRQYAHYIDFMNEL